MTRAELKQQIVDLCEGSGLTVADRVGACRAALTTVQLNVSPGLHVKRDYKPLTRPSGQVMGKKKREAKDG